jgi:hypothetical protein
MTALLMTALFLAAALLGAGTLVHAWTSYRHRFAELRAQLREVERGVSVQFACREPAPTATVYQLRFTPQAECLPFRPTRPVPVAA